MQGVYVTHSEAIDLAIDALDFKLEELEQVSLDEHLAGCASCREEIDRIREDDSLVKTSIEWQDDFDGGGYDEYDFVDKDGIVPDPDEDTVIRGSKDDIVGDDDITVDARAELDEDDDEEDEQDDADGAGFSLDDVLRDTELDDETTFGGEGSTQKDLEELDEDEADAKSAASSEDSDTSDADAEAERERAAAQAEAEAAAGSMSDEDLGDIDSEKQDDDGLYPDCAADGVESAAQANGARVNDQRRKDAERAIRDDEGVERTAYGKVAVYKSTAGILQKRGWNTKPEVSGYAAAAIRNAILRSRTGTTGVERYQKRGKLDGKSLHRMAMQDTRIFKRNTAPDPGKFLVWVMVDVSGSMGGSPVADAASVARALADASMGTPTVRLEIWAWSDPFMRRHAYDVGCRAGVVRVWNRHMPTTEVFKLTELPMGGTPDSPVLDWAWRAITREAHQGEQPVIIMCSDGWGDYQMPQAIDRARKHGVLVKSVALGQLSESQQEERFGRDNYVPWQGSISATARPLANLILRIATGKGERLV